ncbi:MAG: glycosyltransferase family 39 protein [Patescibacteria group bacterium]
MKQKVSKLSIRKIFFFGVALLWVVIVSYYYYTNPAIKHIYPALWFALISIFLVPALLTVLFLGILWFKKAVIGKRAVFSFSLIEALVVFWGMVLLGLVITGLEREIITFGEVLPAIVSLGFKIIIISVWLLLLTSVTYLSGSRVLGFVFKKKLNGLSQFVYSTSVGYILLSFGLLGLSLIKLLNPLGVIFLFGLLLLIGLNYWRSLWEVLNFRFSVNSSFTDISVWSGWLLFLAIVLNFSIMIEPFPSGWDSLTYYFRTAKELATTGAFVRGRPTYPVELVYSSGFVFGKTIGIPDFGDMLGIFVSGWGGLVGVAVIVLVGKYLKDIKTGILAATIFYTMPLVTYFNGWEPKTEVTQSLFLTLTLSSYLTWRKSKTGKWLFLAAAFFGFSFLIKPTAIFIFPALAVVFVYDLLWGLKKEEKVQSLLSFALAGLVCAFVLFPWLGVHYWEKDFRVSRIQDLLEGSDPRIRARGTLLSRAGITKQAVESTGFLEDYGRYLGDEEGWWGLEKLLPEKLASIPFSRYLSLPWDITMVSNREHMNMMISSLFLALLPVYAVLRLFSKKTINKLELPEETWVLTIFTLVYLASWIVKGWGVTWYAMGMLVSLSLLLALVFLPSLKYPKIKWFLIGLFMMNRILSLIIQMDRYGDRSMLHFALGKTSRDETIDLLFPKYREMFTAINSDPEIQRGEKYVLWVSTYIPYFINNSRQVLIRDQYLDNFNRVDLAYGRDNTKTEEALKKAGIKYIIINLHLFYVDETTDRTLQKKTLRFMDFASKSLILREVEEEKGILFLEVI